MLRINSTSTDTFSSTVARISNEQLAYDMSWSGVSRDTKPKAAMALNANAVGITYLEGDLSARWPIRGKRRVVSTIEIKSIFLKIFSASCSV